MGVRSLARSLGGHWRLRAEAETVAEPEGGQSGVTSTLSRVVISSGVGCCYKQSGLESDEREAARMRVLGETLLSILVLCPSFIMFKPVYIMTHHLKFYPVKGFYLKRTKEYLSLQRGFSAKVAEAE